MRKKATTARVTGLEAFGLTDSSFRGLRSRSVAGYAYLRTFHVTPSVQKLPPSKRYDFMVIRASRWIESLRNRYPESSFRLEGGKQTGGKRQWSDLPATLKVSGPAQNVYELAQTTAVHSIHIMRIAGRRRRHLPKLELEWYCVRALVVIRVEGVESGLQDTEDRFVLVRASSFEDAKKRLRSQWREYATPYLNSQGRMVSWSLERIVDVYVTCETEIDSNGTEVYSKLAHRRIRPSYVWRP